MTVTGVSQVRELYAACKPWKEEHLDVSDLHKIWVGQYGKQDGKPVVFVHGGHRRK